MTGRDVITAALRLIGAYAPGESVEASEATDGLGALNRMLGGWSTEGLLIHAITAETPLTLTPGDSTVTLGASGDITTRPQKIESALIRDASSSVDGPLMRILTLEEYSLISSKTTQATYPDAIYDDGGFPQRTLYLYPVPSAAHKLVLFTKRALTEITTLDTAVSLPPGYDRGIIYNLAIELAPEYGKAVPDSVVMVAQESKAGLKRMNDRSVLLRVDDALQPGGGRYNIYTGGN